MTPDAVLKLFALEPENRILDPDAAGSLLVRLRFNQAIDQWPDNRNRFHLRGPKGAALPIQVDIVG